LQERIEQFRERKQHYQQLQQTLAASGESQISLTDPDSRAMPVTQGMDVCYNVEMVVDSKHKLIVTHFLTTDVTGQEQLAPMAKQAKAVIQAITFLSRSDDTMVQPDAAVKVLESIAHTLRANTHDELLPIIAERIKIK
jgi:transposase